MSDWHRPAGSLAAGLLDVDLSPAEAGWTYCGLQVVSLDPGGFWQVSTGTREMAIVPLAGSLTVEIAGAPPQVLAGRSSVFARVTDWFYAPIGVELRLDSHAGAQVALCSAEATVAFEPLYTPAEAVAVEVRGAGVSTRQVNNFMHPDTFASADRLMCVEVLTPGGNISSYPPHRHDGLAGCPYNNEEIYYFRVGQDGTTATSSTGFAMHRTYDTVTDLELNVSIGDGDVFLVPRGYHGPCVAPAGYPLYYLNVLAGPQPVRDMGFCDDPAHAWIRSSWEGQARDPRCPMTSAAGPVSL